VNPLRPSDGRSLAAAAGTFWAGGRSILLLVLLLAIAACAATQEPKGAGATGAAVEEELVDAGLGAAGIEPPAGAEAAAVPQTAAALLLVFFDVGQGDAVLIRAPTGQTVLYDGGDGRVDLVPKLRDLGVSELSLVIASHNHADHIGGLIDVIRAFRPRFVMDNGVPHTTRTYERFLKAIEAAESQLLEPTRRTIRLGEAELLILPPPGRPSWDHNDNSVGVIVRYGAFRASLGGDAEHRQWAWWLADHRDLLEPVHVHKASHHGSRNGDTREAMRVLRPGVVVIGLAADNPYGHPHEEALSLYRSVDATVYRTDLHGRITVEAQHTGDFRVTSATAAASSSPPAQTVPPRGDCVDVNRANAEALRRIRHIDQERAEQIVRLRREHPFRSVSEITRVNGIGSARARDIQQQGLACVAR
jgi:competence protein ComEC